MRQPQRLIAAAVLIAFSGALAGCSSGFGSGFDPSDMLDFLDTKKKLPGERKPVFPDGVPGLEQGVPKDLYKGARQGDPQQNANVEPGAMAPAAAPPPEPPKPKRGAKGKPAPAAPVAAAPADPDAAPEEEAGTAAAPPAPPPKKITRKRTTAPPADQPAAAAPSSQQSAAPFPAPMPSSTFSR